MEPRIVFLQPKIGMAAAALSGLVVTDPCADITAALGPTPSSISCESQPSSCDTEEETAIPAVQARAERKGSAPSKQGKAEIVESVPSSTADGPACSTPIERCNGGGSIQFEPSPLLAVEGCEKGSSPPREDLRVTSNSDDTGLGNMDSLLSVQSPSSISNGFSHSNDDSSLPPSFSRLPPDGHEFPPNYQEPLRTAAITMTSDLSMTKTSENSSVIDSPPDMPPPPLPSSCPPQKDLTEAAPPKPKSLPPPPPVRKPSSHTDMSSFSSRLPPRSNAERRHWMKDEKSEKSVRDKIAMFQSEKSGGENPPPVPPVPAIRSPAKYEVTEEMQNKSSPGIRKIPQWDDPRGKHHLSRSMLAVDGTGRMNDHTPTSPQSHGLHTSSLLYKNVVHNSTGDVSSGNEGGAGDGSRAFDFARTRSTMDLTSSSASCSPDSSLSSASSYSSTGVAYATLPRKPTAIPRPPPVAAERKGFVSERRPQSPDSSSWRTSAFSPTRSGNLHSRSQSLVDVATPKRHSIGGTYNYRYSNSNGLEDSRKSSLNAMIEQRRKNVSKLRGLVIPEKPEVPRCDQSVFDLPEIKSRDAIIISANCNTSTLPRCESKLQKRWSENMNGHSLKTQNAANVNHQNGTTNGVTLTSPPWKSQAPLPDLPKYSPAFKRRSLSVHGLSSTPSESNRDDLRNHNQDQFKIIPPMKPPRASNGHGLVPSSPLGPEPKSLESITSPRSDTSFDFSQICHTDSSKEDEVVPVIKSNGTPGSFVDGHNGKSSHRGLLHVPHSRASAEDSDNDSAVSSSRSSISHGFSPPSSPLPGDTSDGGHRPSAPRQHISRDRIHPEDRHRSKNSSRHSGGSASERANSPDRRPLRRTLSSETTASVSSAASTASTVTSGSQDGGHGGSGSDSSSNRRVLKAQSVEAINRKNVLASAKYSSGRDLKVGSPLIKRKFDEDGSGTEADIEDAAKIETMPPVENSVPRSNGLTHYQTTREVNGIHDIETTRNMDIKVAYVDEIIEYPFVNGNVELVEPPMPAQRRVADSYPSISSSPRATSPISEYSTTESVCGSHREDKKTEVHAPEDVSAAEELKRSTSASPSGVRIDRWMELEKKYAPKTDIRNSMEIQESHVYRGHILEDEMDYLSRKAGLDLDKTRSRAYIEKQKDSGNVFRAIAEKWQIISNDSSTVPSPTNPVAAAASIPASIPAVNGQFKKHSKVESYEASRTTPSSESSRLKLDESYTILSSMETSTLVSSPQANGETAKSESVRLRDRKPIPSLRPLSFNDCSDKTLTPSPEKESYTPPESRVQMTPEPKISSAQSPVSTTAPVLGSQRPNNRRSVSVNDIRKAFEKAEPAASTNVRTSTVTKSKTSISTTTGSGTAVHTRVSSLDSTTSEDSNMPTPAHYGSVNNLASNHRDQFGSITSLASSTSLISPQELQQLIEEANQSLDETSSSGGGAPLVHEVEVVVLHREMAGSSVGITLAGGADYEAKEITVHKVLAGSPAERDGRVQRGDRILSINGKSTKGATHREAISILKAPRSEVVLVVSRSRLESSQTHQPQYQGTNGAAELSMAALSAAAIRSISSSSRPPRIAEQPMEGNGGDVVEEIEEKKVGEESRGPPETVVLTKDGAGLGFSLEGGKDSPSGDKPLTVKKIFTGGAAEKHGGLHVGDELLIVNGIDVTPLSRIEAWGIMKKLPDGMVSLTIRRKV